MISWKRLLVAVLFSVGKIFRLVKLNWWCIRLIFLWKQGTRPGIGTTRLADVLCRYDLCSGFFSRDFFMQRFFIGILCLLSCFGTCPFVMGSESLLVTLREQEEIAQRVIDLMNANRSSIRTWQGKVSITSRTFKNEHENSVPSKELKYEVDFAFDVVSGNKAWDCRFLLGNTAHSRENSFIHDETYHCLTTGHSRTGGEVLRQLHISAMPPPAVGMLFDPFEESLPASPGTIRFRFSMTILEPRMANRRGNKDITEEQNEKFKQDVLANGFKDYKFRLNGNVFTREYVISGHLNEVFVVDFAQGGSILAYKRFGRVSNRPEPVPVFCWDATYQKVGSVWIPKTTKSSEILGDGSLRVKEIEWSGQKINQKLQEERFTVKGIGAFHGMDVIDYRIGGKGYKATGDEYPPEYELPVRKFTAFQWIMMGIGILMILIGGGSLICKKLKALKAK